MNLKFLTSIALSSIMIISVSCSNSQKAIDKNNSQVNTENNSEPLGYIPNHAVDFTATADDQSWQLSVTFDEELIFIDRTNNIQFSILELTKEVAQGANVVHLFGRNALYEVKVIIDVVECNKSGKEVNIMVRKLNGNKEFDYSGCGVYRGDPKIHDVWALHELNGEEINPKKFPREFPHFEFDLAQQKMSGFAGCNQVNGNIRFDYNKIIIEPLISTRMYCSETSDIENEILKILRNNPVYKIKDSDLYLEIPGGSIILRKVD